MGKVLFNICVLLSAVVILRGDVVTKKYKPDDNRIIKRLHGSAHAKSFLYGCDAEPYTQLTTNKTTESDFFQLQKASEYLFAIFTLDEVSVIISNRASNSSNGEDSDDETDFVIFNITLGINKNSKAMLEVFVNETLVGNVTQRIVPILPTIPHYINVSITEDDEAHIAVYEARTNASEPFLSFNITENTITTDEFFVKFKHSSPIFAHFDCCEACTPWIYTRISGCSKYSATSTEYETAYSLCDINTSNRAENILFSENIVVNHDGSPTFNAKIIFAEFSHFRGNRYEIGLSDSPTIFHFVNSSANFTTPAVTLKREYITPFIVNITITKDGIVSLRQPYEKNPFLLYGARSEQRKLKPVAVKYMKMVKFHEDFIRYDFFYNCTDLLWFADKHERIEYDEAETETETETESEDVQSTDNNKTETYPRIYEYESKRYKTLKYDVLHVFQDSYQIYEKSKRIVSEDSSDYEDQATSENVVGHRSEKAKEETTNTKSKGFIEMLKKAIVGVGSFLCVGILKLIFSLDCAKNVMKELDVDDDTAEDLRNATSKIVGKNVADTLGIEFDE